MADDVRTLSGGTRRTHAIDRDIDGHRVELPDAPTLAEGIIAVVFEWDGQRPPSSFYRNVRHKLLSVWKRYGREQESSDLAFWFQESVFLVADERLARLLAGIGAEKGCSRVLILIDGNVYAPDERDRRAARNLLKLWSRPGPRHFKNEEARIAKYREDIEGVLGERIFPDENGEDVAESVRFVPTFF